MALKSYFVNGLTISVLLLFFSFPVNCSIGGEQKEISKKFRCEDGNNNDVCDQSHYNGLMLLIQNHIRTCTALLQQEGLEVKNIMGCVDLGQRLQQNKDISCGKKDPNCNGCKCLAFCVINRLYIADGNGTVDEPTLFQIAKILSLKLPSFAKFHNLWQQCSDITGENNCDRCFNILRCLNNINQEESMNTVTTMIGDVLTAQMMCNRDNCASWNV